MTRSRRRFCAGATSAALVGGGSIACRGRRRSVDPTEPVRDRLVEDMDAVAALLWPPAPEVELGAQTAKQRALVWELGQGIAHEQDQDARPSAELHALAREARLSLEVWQVPPTTLWVLREAPEHRRGAGAYLFHPGAPSTDRYLVIQGPHSFHDEGSGQLALRLFLEGDPDIRPRALCVNTLHRYRPRPGVRPRENSPSDVCHTTDHPFNTMLAALVNARPRLDVAQLHGFSDREVETLAKPGRERLTAVVSPGAHRHSGPWSSAVAGALRTTWGSGVRLFPSETRLFGARTNAQGRLLAAHPQSRFVHIELAGWVRAQATGELVRSLALALGLATAIPVEGPA